MSSLIANRPAKLRFGVLFLVALTSVVCSSAEASGARSPAAAARVTVALLILDAPSGLQITEDLTGVGTLITSLSQLTPGAKVYAEAWCQTPGPNGIGSAVIDVTYETAFFDTSLGQVSLDPQWGTLPFDVSVDDATGLVDDLGGNNFAGLGVAPQWAKIGTVEFDVIATPAVPVLFCSQYAEGVLRFGIVSEGSVHPDDVDYGCCGIPGCALPEAVPTVSQWGFVAMTLLILIAGTLVLRWRQLDDGGDVLGRSHRIAGVSFDSPRRG